MALVELLPSYHAGSCIAIYSFCHLFRPGLTLRQIKHVLRASRSKGAPQKSVFKTIYLTSQILGSKTYPKSPKIQVNLIDVPEKATSSFTETSIRYSECCQKLIDAYPDDLNSNVSTELQQFHSYIRHKFSATKAIFSHAE